MFGSVRVEAPGRHISRAANTTPGEAGGDDSGDDPVIPGADDPADGPIVLDDDAGTPDVGNPVISGDTVSGSRWHLECSWGIWITQFFPSEVQHGY